MYKYDDPRWYEEKYPEHGYSVVQKQQNEPSNTVDDNLTHHSLPSTPQVDISEQDHKSQLSFLNQRFHLRQILEQFLIIIPFVIIAFWIGWFSHQFYSNSFFNQSDQSKAEANLVQSAWDKIDQNYVDRKDLDYKKMAYTAINAMVQSLGDTGHTRFIPSQNVKLSYQQLNGKFTGIGVYLSQDPQAKNLIINATIPGSPAQKANLKHGDIIVAVNDANMKDKDIQSAENLIKGPAGTRVRIIIQRPNEEHLREVNLTRSEILVPNVNMYYIPQSHIADIQIVRFATGVTTQLRDAISQAKKKGATKIILDLRNNPGGYLQEAIDTTSLLVKNGLVLFEQDSNGKRTPIPVNSHGNTVDTSLQIVVLVNEHSASAAEIVAGALHDNHRAILLGQKTFGTGTILMPFTLSDGSVLFLGTREWLTPNGHFLRQHHDKPSSGGITPDIVVPAKSNTAILVPISENEQHLTEKQILNSEDIQLSSAISYLTRH